MADPDVSCPVCAAMYRTQSERGYLTNEEFLASLDHLEAHDRLANPPDAPQGQNGTPTAERRPAE